MKTVYGCPWIEWDEWSRPGGWKLFACDIEETRELCEVDSRKGPGSSGYYFGPIRPVSVYEIPFDCLPNEAKEALNTKGTWLSNDYWDPKFSTCI